jgi:DNA-binding PadR family transcriptional regulator
MVTGLPARRDPCDDKLRQATLVDFRGSNLSDAGSIPAISTKMSSSRAGHFRFNNSLDNYIRRGYIRFMATTNSNTPLTPAVFHILLALSNGERHGYGIMKQVEADSQGKVTMGPGTLYGSLKRMLDAGLVKESDKRVDPEMDDERRIYYQLTGVGAQALKAELERYQRIVTIAQQRKLFPKTFAYAS